MIEFAVSIIVLFMLVFGVVGIAMAFYTYEVMNQYARDASRYAIVHGNGCNSPINGNCSIATSCTGGGTSFTCSDADSALKTYLNHQIYPGINGTQLQVTTTYTHAPGLTTCFATNCNGAGDQVTVDVAYPYLYNIPFIPSRLITMHGASTMVISQ